MANCAYHPDKRGTGTCPECKEHICDRCRLNGTSARCGTCQTKISKGTEDRSRCDNHKDIPTDTKCGGCRKFFCAACLNGQRKCFNCAMKPVAPPPDPRQRRSRGTGSLKGATKTGKLKKPAPVAREFPVKIVAGVGAVVLMVGLGFGAMTLLKKPEPQAAYSGPAQVAILAPGAGPIRGGTFIKLRVASPKDVDRVEVTIDGKYWERFKKPPFNTHWPTSLFKNGDHTIQAKVIYRGGAKQAVAKKRVRTWNQQ
jgi:hypothetical protein